VVNELRACARYAGMCQAHTLSLSLSERERESARGGGGGGERERDSERKRESALCLTVTLLCRVHDWLYIQEIKVSCGAEGSTHDIRSGREADGGLRAARGLG
jgi:hypothetical protein